MVAAPMIRVVADATEESGAVGAQGTNAESVVALIALKGGRIGGGRGCGEVVLLTTEEEVSTTFAINGVITLKGANGVGSSSAVQGVGSVSTEDGVVTGRHFVGRSVGQWVVWSPHNRPTEGRSRAC